MDIVNQAQKAARRQLFSPAMFEQIKRMVDRGLSPPEIAARIGCTLGSFQVK
jgi:hypothetical protein